MFSFQIMLAGALMVWLVLNTHMQLQVVFNTDVTPLLLFIYFPPFDHFQGPCILITRMHV